MKVRLAFRDRDLDLDAAQPPNVDVLSQDLGLVLLVESMAAGDGYLRDVAARTLFVSLDDVAEIRYRQGVLTDCLAHPETTRRLYEITVDALKVERQFWMYSTQHPASVLSRSVRLIQRLASHLRALRTIAEEHEGDVASDGFRRLFRELRTELDEAYLRTVEDHLRRLEFGDGVLLSATIGATNRDTQYTLRRRTEAPGWRERVGLGEPGSRTWEVPPRDEAGADLLGALRDRGIALAAAALGESADHVLGYLGQLRAELGFYVACLNLHLALSAKGEPTCMPDPVGVGNATLSAAGLYDACLSLAMGDARAVGSDAEADDRELIVITGPNRGGKSTFLRSLGVAQLMMQAGMFVAARAFRADVRHGVFTHFRREEDVELRSGKLDEELSRMSSIVDDLKPDSLVLLNESFASTNEREGSEIGRQIVRALVERGIKVGYVTHMFDLAASLRAEHDDAARFLRAERLPDGRRTFKVVPGEPLPTSHGQDIYHDVFTDIPAAEMTPAATAMMPAASPGERSDES